VIILAKSNSSKRKAAHNMGFSAMLAEEYKLIDISLIKLQSGLDE